MENQMHHFVAPLQYYYPDNYLISIDQSTLLSDEFRMYGYKIIQCPRNQSHEWTTCPFAHQGERARRRDLSRNYYTAIPCPKFKTGAGCEKGDLCELAHGVFESWLHPARYKTRKCNAGEFCRRNVCFFAHTEDELRPETTYKRYVLTNPLNPAMPGRSTIGFESNGHFVLPFQNPYGTVSSTHANQSLLASTSGIGPRDEVADSLAMLNIKDGEYELPKMKLGQPKMTDGSSSRSTNEESCLNSIDHLPQELKWIAELVKDN